MSKKETYPYELTAQDREDFHAALKKWQVELNLNSWRMVLLKGKAKRDAMADVEIDPPHRLIKVRLTDRAREPFGPGELEAYALHEMLHVRLADLIHVVKNDAEESIIDSAEHDIIGLLVKKLMGFTPDGA